MTNPTDIEKRLEAIDGSCFFSAWVRPEVKNDPLTTCRIEVHVGFAFDEGEPRSVHNMRGLIAHAPADIRFLLSALKEAQGEKWISVEERLPKEELPVLVFMSYGKMDVCQLVEGHWTDVVRSHSNGSVTHWMPLPPAPKGDNA